MGEQREPRARYTPQHDELIKKLYLEGWSQWEIAYRLSEKFEINRRGSAVGQRIMRLHSEGLGKKQASTSSITQETIDWAKKTFDTELEPSAQMRLAEVHPRKKHKKRQHSKSTVKRNGVTARELLGLTKTKGSHEPQPSYAVFILRAERKDPQLLNLFEGLLETAINEKKTAVDILDDLRLARA